MLRLLRAQRREVELLRHLPRRGLAEQRAFLLDQARAPWCCSSTTTSSLEPDLIERLARAIGAAGCGFVGSAVHGLSHLDDERPQQQAIEFWDGPVEPERSGPTARSGRATICTAPPTSTTCSAASASTPRRSASTGSPGSAAACCSIPRSCAAPAASTSGPNCRRHCGEDVLAQLRVMARDGGCGLIPSGAYHQELPTTVPLRRCDAPRVLAHRLA